MKTDSAREWVGAPVRRPRTIAIVVARGGSKRIPRKNLRLFRGHPIIRWPLHVALAAGIFDVVMVSTEDNEIADVARMAGAEVPFLRSHTTAGDYATTSDVIIEVLQEYIRIGVEFDLACCIYPTAVFMRSADLIEGRELLLDSNFDVVMPVALYSYPVWRSLHREAGGKIKLNFPEYINSRSQDLTPAFHDAGQWYWLRTDAFLRDRVLMGSRTGSLVLPASRVQDIDNEEDWGIAELKHTLCVAASDLS